MDTNFKNQWKEKYKFTSIDVNYLNKAEICVKILLDNSHIDCINNCKIAPDILLFQSSSYVVETLKMPLNFIPKTKINISNSFLQLSGHPLAINYILHSFFSSIKK